MTGEWTFGYGSPLEAKTGTALEKFTRTGAENFTEGTDGIATGDGWLRAGQNNMLKCYHGLPTNSDYTIVMDVRVPNNENASQSWHALLWAKESHNDGDIWLKVDGGAIKLRMAGDGRSSNVFNTGIEFDQWVRVVIAYTSGSKRCFYVNGSLKREATVQADNMEATENGYFYLLGDNDGEDYDVDISYAAIYDKAMSADEISLLHSQPLAAVAAQRPVPVARWDFNNYDSSNPMATGILAATVGDDAKPLLYSNEGTVTVGGKVQFRSSGARSAESVVSQYAVVTANTTPIIANGLAYNADSWSDWLVASLGSMGGGATLALPANGDGAFTTPDIIPVTLPAEGTATIRIDGEKLERRMSNTSC